MIRTVVHAAIGTLLLTSHAVFLLRGLRMRRSGRKPSAFDRAARFLSHLLLPLTLLTGWISLLHAGNLSAETGVVSGPLRIAHFVTGILPIAAIFVFAPLRPLRRRIPWLLPGINLLLFLAAFVTGTFALWRLYFTS